MNKEQIKAILEVIKKYQTSEILKKAGVKITGGKILCPAHDDHNPSCQVFHDGLHCFSCRWHGDIIEYFKIAENRSFPKAVERVARIVGLEVSDSNNVEQYETQFIAQRLEQIGDFVFAIRKRSDSLLTSELKANSFNYFEVSTFRLYDLKLQEKNKLSKPNVILLPAPGIRFELTNCVMLSAYLDIDFLNWERCPVQTIKELTPEIIACSLQRGLA